MPFSFNGWEIFLLIVLAVLIFGPDKLPELARKTARVIAFLRNVANNATRSVKAELGPEYEHLQLSDLNPKNLIAKELADLEQVKAEINDAATRAVAEAHDVNAVVAEAHGSTAAPAPVERADVAAHRYDDAT